MPSPQGKLLLNINSLMIEKNGFAWNEEVQIIFIYKYSKWVVFYKQMCFVLVFLDSSNSGGDNMYTLMKPAGGNMGGVSANKMTFFSIFSNNSISHWNFSPFSHNVCHANDAIDNKTASETQTKQMNEFKQEFPMGSSGDGNPMGPMGGPNSMGNVLNGNDLDGMKNSPANGGPGTPREDSGSGIGDYNLSSFGGPGENVSFIWTLAKTKQNQLFPILHTHTQTHNTHTLYYFTLQKPTSI